MFQFLQRKEEPQKFGPDPGQLSIRQLLEDAGVPISVRAVTNLPAPPRDRLLRILLPPYLLSRFRIKPSSWRGPDGDDHVRVTLRPQKGLLRIEVRHSSDAPDPFYSVELQDNAMNGVDLNLIVLGDPHAPRFDIDMDEEGRPTQFGTVRRNLAQEQEALHAGLAPGQVRAGLKASRDVLQHVETFLAMMTHFSFFLEPLTYASAWVFERRGFAYVRGHKLMDDIHREFQVGGRLHAALDGSTPFRHPEHWRTVRGRAWAVHDGILSEIGQTWDGLRMVKQIGQHASVNTFPGADY